jgi:hypothetical protein
MAVATIGEVPDERDVLYTTDKPAAKAETVSPPATEKANGRLLQNSNRPSSGISMCQCLV